MRTLLVVILGLVAVSMVVTLVPGISGPSQTDENVLAEVGPFTVTVEDVRRNIDDLLRQQRLTAGLVQAYLPQLIDQAIEERAVAYMARDLGNKITDQELANAIQSSMPMLFQGGQFNKEQYQAALGQMGMTVAKFETDLRTNQLLKRLSDLALEGIVVPPADVEREFKRRNARMKIEYVTLQSEKFKDQVTASDADLTGLFNGNRSAYRIPEKRSFNVLIADEARLGESVQVPDAQLLAAYNRDQDRFRTPERANVRHILVSTQGVPADQTAAKKAKAEDLLKQLRAGGDFAELAKKNSDDPGSAVKGGDLGWIVRQQTVPNFENASFTQKVKEIGNLVQTEFGYHIVEVMERETARLRPFDEVKGTLALELKRDRVNEMMNKVMDDARKELQKNPSQADAIATKYNLQIVKVEKISNGEPIPVVGQSPDLNSQVFGARAAEITLPVQPQVGKLAIAQITAIEAARNAEFDEVKERIADSFAAIKAQELAQNKAKEIFAQAKASNDLKAAAKSAGLEVKTSDEFAPDGAIAGLGSAQVLGDQFGQPVGTIAGPMNIGGQWAIVKIVDKKEADMTKLAAERETLVMQLKGRVVNERRMLFRDSVVNYLLDKGKVKKNKEVIDRLVNSYRS